MEIIFILAFIALVAVIFGVTMHEAFWGIIFFIIGAFLVTVIAAFIKAFYSRTQKKVTYMKTPKGKSEIKKKINDRVTNLLVVLWLFSPFIGIILLVILTHLLPEFSKNFGWLEVLLAFSPFVIGAVIFIRKIKEISKKNANRKD